MLFALPLFISSFHIDYATYLGGSGDESAAAIAVDSSGNAYVTGSTSSPDFPLTSQAFGAPSRTSPRAYVTKLNAGGTDLLWSVCIANMTAPLAIGLDSADNVYVLSYARIVKLAAAGNLIVYSRSFNDTGVSVGAGLAVDAFGNAYVVGSSTQLATTADAFQTTLAAGSCYSGHPVSTPPSCPDAFAMKLAPDGSTVFATYIGGSGSDQAQAVAVDAQGNAWITGDTESSDFPVTADALQSTYHGTIDLGPGIAFGDAFVAKLDPTGSKLLYSTYLGGSQADGGLSIAVDRTGAAYVAGATQSSNFPATSGVVQPIYTGPPLNTIPGLYGYGFLAKFSASGSLVYSTFIDAASTPQVLVDAQGDAYLPGNGLSELNSDASRVLRSIAVSGTAALDSQNNVYFTGTTQGFIFFPTQGSAQMKFGGGTYDASVTKLDFTAPQSAWISNIVNAAGQRSGLPQNYPVWDVAPGEIITVYGLGFDENTRLLFDGIAAPILHASAGQINAEIPFEVETPITAVTLVSASQTFGYGRMQVYPAVPALFTANGTGKGQAAVLNQDGSVNSVSNPAPRGSTISVFMTGAGHMLPEQIDGAITALTPPFPTTALPVTCNLGQVTYAGAAPGLVAGAVQVNIQISPNAATGTQIPIVIYVGGFASGFTGDTTVAVQ